MICPKCGASQATATKCRSCGVIIAKAIAAAARKKAEREEALRDASRRAKFRPLWLGVSFIALVVFVYQIGDRLTFLRESAETRGVVTKISARNYHRCDRYGNGTLSTFFRAFDSSTNTTYRTCTEFSVAVSFVAENKKTYVFEADAGSEAGRNQSKSYANYRVGESLPVLYNRSRPVESYLDDKLEIWSVPIIAFVVMVVSFVFRSGRPA